MIRKFIYPSGDIRTNIVKANILGGGFIKGANIFVSLLLVPLTINYVNSELYGIWLALSSIATWFGFFDLGFGFGLRNRLTTAIALNKYKYGRILVSTAYSVILLVFSVIAIFAYWGCRYVNWANLLNVSALYNEIIICSFQIIIIAFCIRMVLQIVVNVCQAYQKTALASSIDLIGNILSLSLVYVLTLTVTPNLFSLSAILCMSPLLALLVANILLFQGPFKDVRPSIRYIRRFVIVDISAIGLQFFLLQIVNIELFQATNFIISHFCGPDSVTVYNIVYKYLAVSLMAFTVIQSPIWSAYNDAYAKSDYIWMRNIYKKIIKVLVFAEIGLFSLVILSPIVYKIWIGDSVTIPFYVTCFVGIYMGLSIAGSMHAMIVNGMGKIRLQTRLAIIQGVIYIPMVYYMASEWGLEGILVSLIISSLFSLPIIFVQVPRLLKQTATGIFDQ